MARLSLIVLIIAFSRHDAKAWVKFCTPDAQLVTVRGESMNGVGEIEKGLTTIFQTRGRNVTLKTLSVTVRFIRPDVALAHVTPGTEHPSAGEGSRHLAHHRVSQHDSAAVITAHSGSSSRQPSRNRQTGWPGCGGPIRYGRIISLSSCSTM